MENSETTLEEVIGAGDRVFVMARFRGRGRASGAEVEGRHFEVYTLRNGKVLRVDEFADPSRRPRSRWAVGVGDVGGESVEIVAQGYAQFSATGAFPAGRFEVDFGGENFPVVFTPVPFVSR